MVEYILQNIIPAGVVVVQGFMAWVLWSLRREFLSRSEWAAEKELLHGRGHCLEQRILKAEQQLNLVPSEMSVHRLDIQMQSLAGDIKALEVNVSGVRELLKRFATVVERQEDFLLNNGKK